MNLTSLTLRLKYKIIINGMNSSLHPAIYLIVFLNYIIAMSAILG